jgi:hypothetical protein
MHVALVCPMPKPRENTVWRRSWMMETSQRYTTLVRMHVGRLLKRVLDTMVLVSLVKTSCIASMEEANLTQRINRIANSSMLIHVNTGRCELQMSEVNESDE